MILKLSNEVEAILASQGWFPKRRIDIRSWIEQLQGEGFHSSCIAAQILQNLGGLKFAPPRPGNTAYAPDDIIFNPIAAASGEIDRFDGWNQRYQLNLFPLGECLHIMILSVNEDGRVFAGTRGAFCLVGADLSEALEVLTLARKRPIVFK